MKLKLCPWPKRSLRTLVLDDDRRWRELVAFNVEMQLGIRLFLRRTAKTHSRSWTKCPIDLVVSDLIMPEMDGLQFMKRAPPSLPTHKNHSAVCRL
jgi:DNA-binding NtrC family response regulator